MRQQDMPLVGLVPAGGQAARMGRLPCSKEILPLAADGRVDAGRPEVVSADLVGQMARAGCRRIVWVIRPGKWDIPAFWGSGRRAGVAMGYVLVEEPFGVPYTLDAAGAFIQDCRVIMGLGDIRFEHRDAACVVARHQSQTGADLVLGLMAPATPEDRVRSDMVEVDADGRVRRIHVKPQATDLSLAWALAAWQPSFTAFLHRWVADDRHARRSGSTSGEAHLGRLFQDAVDAGLHVSSVAFPASRFFDLGTPEAWRSFCRGKP